MYQFIIRLVPKMKHASLLSLQWSCHLHTDDHVPPMTIDLQPYGNK